MLSKAVANKVKNKLFVLNKTKKDLAEEIKISYVHLLNVLNRKVSSERVELLLKKWSDE
jgi:hypothetical protein